MTIQLECSVVRIRAANGGTVGAGFLVSDRQVLTCAHVVAGVLENCDAPSVVRDALRDLELIRAAGVEGLEPAFELLESAREVLHDELQDP
jgi:hypothetical protein